MKSKTDKIVAKALMTIDNDIWEDLNIRSGSQIRPHYGGSPKLWRKYQKAVKNALIRYGISKSFKISEKTRDILEDQNYHSLNQAIDFLGFGEGVYGITKEQFFGKKTREK